MALYVFADIEATRDPAMGEYEPSGEKDPFPPPAFHKVEMVSILVLDDWEWKLLEVVDHDDERATLTEVVGRIERRWPCMVTFNGRRYDVPVIQARAMRHGIPFAWSFEASSRYGQKFHFDLADVASNFGAAKATSLDHWSRLIGWPGKLDGSGKKVEAVLREPGGRDHLRHYCAGDAVLTAAFFIRWRHLAGELSTERTRAATESLIDFTRRSMPGLGPWLDRIDRNVALVGEPPAPQPKADEAAV
jgi:predicted PolB exonuclease-like 3'-5' exonuclease